MQLRSNYVFRNITVAVKQNFNTCLPTEFTDLRYAIYPKEHFDFVSTFLLLKPGCRD